MPYARITSNVAKDDAVVAATSSAVANTLNEQWGVPTQVIMVQVELGVPTFLALSDEPAAFVHARTMGFTEEQKPKTIAALTEIVSEQLKVPAQRIYVVLEDVKVGHWGAAGTTVIPPPQN